MKRSQRGAARVSVTWLIVFLVLFFVACGFGYMGYEAEQRALARATAGEKAAAEAEALYTGSEAQLLEISKVIGWYDPNVPVARTDVAAMKSGFDELRSSFPDMGPDVTTISAALPKARDAYLARGREIGTLRDSEAALKGEKSAIETSLRGQLEEKDRRIDELGRAIADAENNARQAANEAESRIASLNQQRNDLDSQLREARNQMEAQRRQFESDRATFETRTSAALAKLKFLNEPEAVDGKIVNVATDLSLGYINIGSQQRVSRGMRFRVVAGAVGSTKLKAFAEVTDVKQDRAEVRLYDVVDRFDPVVAGDVIYNPLFDPTGRRDAVLCGRFSAPFNEQELKVLLSNMNISVNSKLDYNTDYLIVGAELYIDEEGNPLETPLQPSELAIYKDAVANGVQIVSIKQLREYFKF